MTFAYGSRAAILGFGFFFLLHAALGVLVVRAASLRVFDRCSPRAAARLLLTLRLLPALSALLLTCAVVTPAYFRWERQQASEPVGLLVTLAATAGIFIWTQSLARTLRAVIASLSLPEQVLETSEPFLAMAGIVRPRIVVSRGFLQSIPTEQQEVAMCHEQAHFRAGDNFKRLLMLLAPGSNAGYASLEQAWSRHAERAADDAAVAGDPERAALLAEVLVRVARANVPQPTALASTLVGSQTDLQLRVERLLTARTPSQDPYATLLSFALVFTPIAVAIGLASQDASKAVFHLLERLLLHA